MSSASAKNMEAVCKASGKAMVKRGEDTWFFVTVDYAFGHSLEADATAAVVAAGLRLRLQRRFLHQAANGKVRHEQTEELLPDQFRPVTHRSTRARR